MKACQWTIFGKLVVFVTNFHAVFAVHIMRYIRRSLDSTPLITQKGRGINEKNKIYRVMQNLKHY